MTSYIKYQPINELINKLNAIPLSELVSKPGYQLVHNPIMYCYTVNYSTLSVECKHARQQYADITTNYINQQMFSLSGEEQICVIIHTVLKI